MNGPKSKTPEAGGLAGVLESNFENKPSAWLDELPELALRHSHLGTLPDLRQMSLTELRGLYLFLQRWEAT